MRTKRYVKFKKYRQKRRRRIFVFFVLLPSSLLLIGYLLTSLSVLPALPAGR